MPNNKQHHAIVIGINSYPQLGQGSLEGPVNDANDFYDWLRDPEGGDVPAGNIRRILSTDFGPQTACPTPNQVEALFEPFILNGGQGKLGERLYIFAAGHGFGDPHDMNKTALYAANAKMMFPWHIAVTEYVNWLHCNAVFEEIVLIMDCCRTINSLHEITKPQYVALQYGGSIPLPAASKVRYFYAFAVGRGGLAREDKFEDGKSFGFFTKAVLDALRNARPAQGEITGEQVENHIHNCMDKFAQGRRVDPPAIRRSNRDDIMFFKRKTAGTVPVTIKLDSYLGNETLVLYDGSGQEIRQMQADAADLTLDLEPGLYKITVNNTGRKEFFQVPNNEQIVV